MITINIPNHIGSTPIAIAAGSKTGTIIITIDKVSKTSPIATRIKQTTIIKKGATLGANCTIICGIKIKEFAFVGAGAVVRNDVKKYALVVGVPARQIGWMSRYGERIDLPLEGKGKWECKKTGSFYILNNNEINHIEKI